MWDKLLALFKDTYADQESASPVSPKREEPRLQMAVPAPQIDRNIPGQGTLIGHNYLKGLEEDEAEKPKRFINLNKLLRGDYKHHE